MSDKSPCEGCRYQHDPGLLPMDRLGRCEDKITFLSDAFTMVDPSNLSSFEGLVCIMDELLHQLRIAKDELEAAAKESVVTVGQS